jgi:hypothetical protein
MVNGDGPVATYHTKIKMSKRRVMILIAALLFAAVYLVLLNLRIACGVQCILHA